MDWPNVQSLSPDFLVGVEKGATVLVPFGTDSVVQVPQPTGNPYSDYNLLMNAVYAAGVGGVLVFPYGKTYRPMTEIVLASRQLVLGNQSILKLSNQVAAALTTALVMDSSVFWPTYAISVASTAGFYVGQRVALHDATTAGQVTSMHVKGTITSIAQGVVYVRFEIGTGQQVAQTTNTSTWAETPLTSYTWPAGASLCTITSLISTAFGTQRCGIRDLEIDGNASNNPLGNRWELAPTVDLRGDRSVLSGLWAYNTPADAVYVGCTRPLVDTVYVDKPNAMGFHVGAGGTAGGQLGFLRNLFVDTPGFGTPAIGHYGGYTSSHPAYAAVGFSRSTDHLLIDGLVATNTAGVAGTTWGQAVGCITAADNYSLNFSNLKIDGFNKGIGALQIVRSSGGAGLAGQAPRRITFNHLEVQNCGPAALTALNQWEVCSLGASSGTTPHTDAVTINDADFYDSPLIIQDANVVLNDVRMNATGDPTVSNDQATSAALIIIGTSTSSCRAELNGVTSRRNAVTSTNVANLPSATAYSADVYVQGGTVRGNNVHLFQGAYGLRAQSGADIEITGFRAENQYNYGAAVFSSNTRLVLDGLRVRVTAGYTPNVPYAGIDMANAGGAAGAGSLVTLNDPDIEIVTTNASQYGVRLPANAAPTAICSVLGGKVKVSGTSTTPILSGGASGVGVVIGTALSHTFTPGAAEVSSGTVVSTNL